MDNAQELYARFLSGDAAAFDDLVRTFRVPLTRFLTAYLHDPFLAQDVAADCFAYVWAYPKRYNFRSGVKTYLFMLGRSRAIDRLRREKRVVFVEPDDPDFIHRSSHRELISEENAKAYDAIMAKTK